MGESFKDLVSYLPVMMIPVHLRRMMKTRMTVVIHGNPLLVQELVCRVSVSVSLFLCSFVCLSVSLSLCLSVSLPLYLPSHVHSRRGNRCPL